MDAQRKSSHSESETAGTLSTNAANPSEARPQSPTWLWRLQVLALIVVARLAAELAAVQSAERFLAAHRSVFLAITISMAALGLLLFVATLIQLGLQGGPNQPPPDLAETGPDEAPPDPTEAGPTQARPDLTETAIAATTGFQETTPNYSVYRFRGKVFSAEVQDSWTVGGMKAAWGAGDWRSDPVWRRRYLSSAALLLLVIGGFGIVVACAPAWVAMLFAGALLYALVRITWAFWRA